ncbi:hypothetical protein D3C74_301570 [compost metagenome]
MQILFNQRTGYPVDNIPRIYTGHTFIQVFILQLFQISILVAFNLFPVVQTHLLNQINALLFGFLQSGKDGENRCRTQSMRSNMHMTHITLVDQLSINFFLLRHLEIIRNRHHDHPRLKRLVFLVSNKCLILGFIRMSNNQFIGTNKRKSARLEIPLLSKRQQVPQKLLIAFQHLLEFH